MQYSKNASSKIHWEAVIFEELLKFVSECFQLLGKFKEFPWEITFSFIRNDMKSILSGNVEKNFNKTLALVYLAIFFPLSSCLWHLIASNYFALAQHRINCVSASQTKFIKINSTKLRFRLPRDPLNDVVDFAVHTRAYHWSWYAYGYRLLFAFDLLDLGDLLEILKRMKRKINILKSQNCEKTQTDRWWK